MTNSCLFLKMGEVQVKWNTALVDIVTLGAGNSHVIHIIAHTEIKYLFYLDFFNLSVDLAAYICIYSSNIEYVLHFFLVASTPLARL
jgi:hypothetical protein